MSITCVSDFKIRQLEDDECYSFFFVEYKFIFLFTLNIANPMQVK